MISRQQAAIKLRQRVRVLQVRVPLPASPQQRVQRAWESLQASPQQQVRGSQAWGLPWERPRVRGKCSTPNHLPLPGSNHRAKS